MSKYTVTIKKISDLDHAEELIDELGSDPDSISIMAPKMVHRVLKVENIYPQDAIIIKQDMLSIGGEVAVPKDTFQLQGSSTSILISGTLQQHRLLVKKLSRHYNRIKEIAKEIDKSIQSIV